MARPTKRHILCSLLMSILFAYSAAVQLNDHDWYFWLPLYSGACIGNLLSCFSSFKAIINIAEADIILGLFLFVKVVLEDIVNGISGFWSLDLSKRVTREKIGSGLVAISMILQLIASRSIDNKKDKDRLPRYVEYGMLILVGFSYGLPFVFFVIQDGQMKF